MSAPSILIIGATGRIGRCLFKAATQHQSKPILHAFVRTPDKLTSEENNTYTTIITGNATDPADIQRALQQTSANYICIGVGTPHLGKQDIRERNAQAVAQVVANNPDYSHVKIVVMSAVGAGDSKIIAGFGIGMFIEFLIGHPLADHDKQEPILMGLNTEQNKRVLIVRPTYLSNGKATGKTVLFKSGDKCPTISISREDVAKFVVAQICEESQLFGTAVNITNAN